LLLVAFSTLWLEIPDAIAYHVDTRKVWARDERELTPKPFQFDLQENVCPTGIKILPAPKRRCLRATSREHEIRVESYSTISWGYRLPQNP
jgi:hypothetical protein